MNSRISKIENPIRGELFSLERLETHAESLAIAQQITVKSTKSRKLLPRVKENGRILTAGYRAIAQAVREERAITPAAEWLVDNFYIVEEQIREIMDDLPPGFYRRLPKLSEGPLEGYPRVYGIAWAYVAHTDSRVDREWLKRFVLAYQRVGPLYIGEIWALAISLRIVLVENLRRITDSIVAGKAAREEADALADAVLGYKSDSGAARFKKLPDGTVDTDLALRTYDRMELPRAFAVQLVQRLRDGEGRVVTALHWLDRRLSTDGTTAEKIVQAEHQDQTAMNTTVRNIITSMRLLSSMDWSQFFEEVSAVDELLRAESAFAAMDFQTRDLYRHAVEELARGAQIPEVEVVRRILAKTQQAKRTAAENPTLDYARQSDPGYYLIGQGRPDFEQAIQFDVSPLQCARRLLIRFATPIYLGSFFSATALFIAWPLHYSAASGLSPWALTALGLLGLIPASDLALALLNSVVTDTVRPEILPKLDFPLGIPDHLKTLIVVPTLLTDVASIKEQIERLEIHYLCNADGHLQFALLTDWMDAHQEHQADDEALLKTVTEGIQRLNAKWGPGPTGRTRFYVFHRKRTWNAQEQVWMGWERKRGKLQELNRLLRGKTPTTFMGVLEAPSDVRYVITLDADTHLSRGSAYRLVGAMAHPLNRPQFDPISGRVVQGYGLMQPRITPTLPTDGRGSRYQEIFSGPMGVDPYAFAVSDVYQDLYKEGSYVGKGIYDLDAFESSLAGRVPENTMLSHDLFEGVFVRTALLTDVEFFEEFPGHYEVAATRNHRWVRGDWQLIPLIFTGRLAIISRWKMIDNLRRSLSAPSAYLALIAAWIMKDAPVAAVWMSFILSTLALPPLIPVLVAFMPRNRRISLANHWRGAWTDLQLALTQFFLAVVFLPHQAWIMTDAIVRTLYRLLISRRHLLEWRTAALSKNIFAHQLMAYYGRMKSAWILALLAALAVGFSGSEFGVWGVVPFFCLWVLSPWIARHISTPMNEGLQHQLSQESRQAFRRIARKTWRFFETFVTAKQHWLPPDNFQEIPTPVLAHRTSPTNIGLYLLSVLSAHDLGWVGLTETVERLEKTLATMQALPQYQGHLFNWYDTDDLRALEPLYISTVDSGNLAGHLWTVARACRAYIQTPLPNNEIFDGLQDVLQILAEREKELPAERRRGLVSSGEFKEALTALSPTLEALRAADPALPIDWRELKEKSTTLLDIAHAISIVGRPQAADMKTGPSEEEPSWQPAAPEAEIVAWAELFAHQWQSHSRDSAWSGGSIPQAMKERLQTVAALCDEFVNHMRFGFLCDPVKKIFSIGYQMNEQKLDASYYDLLASEARLASFVAIAKGDLPAEHWFRLSRTLSPVNRGMALLSWSGSMFEYLMPELIMRPPVGSLLDQTCRTVVRRQMEYGEERKVPWGISESGYNAQNLEFTYQYSNFGVPGLGLRRGLSTDLLIAPYATALASMIDPAAALKNFQRLSAIGAEGRYGFYEALDYTPTRLPENQPVAIVREFMAHHQGMSLTAILNVLHGGRLAHYFHAEPRVQATELLLQERTPREVPVARIRMEDAGEVRAPIPAVLRRFYSPHDVVPRTHLLSNGHYSVMITSAGSGYSRWRNLAVTRWREDATRDITGTYIFLRDAASGAVWSAGFQPTGVAPDRYEVDFSEDRAEIIRWDGDMITTLEVVVSPEDDAEIRRLAIKNTGSLARTIEVTSYAEIVLATPAADLAHPAFSNLFVQTEYVPEVNGLICSRRPRSPDEAPVWAAHVVVVEGKTIGDVQYESDRAAFLGRGRAVRTPLCVMDGKPLSNTAGAVLDPVVSLRRRILALPGETVHVTFATVIATSRDQVLGLADKYHDPAMFERAVTLAWTHAHIQQHHLGILPSEAHVFQNLASRILYSDAGLRPARELLERNRLGQPGLWAYSISGDLPIVLVRIDEEDDRDIVREILRAHEYWRMKNLAVDLVILNEKGTSYASELQNALEALVRTTQDALRHEAQGAHAATEGFVSKSGGIYVLRADRLSTHDRILLLSAARVILLSRHGTLAQQLERLDEDPEEFHALPLAQRVKNQTEFLKNYLIPPSEETDKNKTNLKRPTLQFFNGWGGFSDDGRDYVITLGPGQWTPAPWINVISNPIFGFQVSESGSGYCWSGNSRENQLTPWSNDPVSDPSGEVFYIRDEESGEVWTPTALPIRLETEHYMARHGQGYSEFTHQSHGILSELMQFVPLADPLKISRLRLTNTTKRDRRISVTAYVEWVLGSSRSANGPFIVTELDSRTQAIFVRNAWNTEFSSRVAFAEPTPCSTLPAARRRFSARAKACSLRACRRSRSDAVCVAPRLMR